MQVTNPAFDIDQDDSGADEDPSLLDPTHTHNDDTHAHSDSDPEPVTERLGANMAAAEAAQRKGQRDMAILNAIVKRVIPRAVHLYMAAPQVSSVCMCVCVLGDSQGCAPVHGGTTGT